MKKFEINENQIAKILNTLLEIPAKNSLVAIDEIRSLKQITEVQQKK